MKRIRVILSIFLLVLISVAWMVQLGNVSKERTEYKFLISEGDRLCSEKLYQQAIQAYESAIKIKDNDTTRGKWLPAYELAYRDGVVTEKEYSKALSEMCSLQPKNAVYWEKLISLYVENREFKYANDSISKAARSGAKSEKIEELRDEVRYSYTEKGKTYTRFYRSPDGYYTVTDDSNWGIMSPDGEWLYERIYYYASPVNALHNAALMSSQDIRVVDEESIVLGILNIQFEQMRAPSDTVIPVCSGEHWSYYDFVQKKTILSSYEDASSFSDGVAAVKKNGKWQLIDANGAAVSNASFDDVKLYSNGEYVFDGIMVAKANGTYGLYDAKGNAVNKFRCKDADAFFGDLIAFQDNNGKWGFVNQKGEVILEPAYDAAKSFSNGLAAVRFGERWGFINASGKCVIESNFYDADYFTKDGVVMVSDLENQYHILKLRFP